MVQGPSPATHRSFCRNRQLQERSLVGLDFRPWSPESWVTTLCEPHPEPESRVEGVESSPMSMRIVLEHEVVSACAQSCVQRCLQTRSGRTRFCLLALTFLGLATSAEENPRTLMRGSQASYNIRPSRKPIFPRATLRQLTKSAHQALPSGDHPFQTQRHLRRRRCFVEVSVTCSPVNHMMLISQCLRLKCSISNYHTMTAMLGQIRPIRRKKVMHFSNPFWALVRSVSFRTKLCWR